MSRWTTRTSCPLCRASVPRISSATEGVSAKPRRKLYSGCTNSTRTLLPLHLFHRGHKRLNNANKGQTDPPARHRHVAPDPISTSCLAKDYLTHSPHVSSSFHSEPYLGVGVVQGVVRWVFVSTNFLMNRLKPDIPVPEA